MTTDDPATTRADHYAVLGVSADSSQREIQSAYWCHLREIPLDAPDGDDRRRRLISAYQVLSDPAARAEYDAQRRDAPVRAASPNPPPKPAEPPVPGLARPPRSGDENLTSYGQADAKDITAVEQLVARQPTNTDLLGYLAFLYYTAGLIDKSHDTYVKILSINGKDAKSHYYLGHCYFRKGLRDKAIAEWESVITLDPFGPLGRRALKRVRAILPGR